MAEIDDEVPPLEDMSELLEQVHKINGNEKTSTGLMSHNGTSEPANSQSATNNISIVKQHNSGRTSKDELKKTNPKQTTSGSFGGMKKGFLFGSSSKPKSAKSKPTSTSSSCDSTADIPLIKPRRAGSQDKRQQHEIAEVQEAMKASTPLLQNTEWVTDDLLKQLEQHPRLLRQLSDPRISQAMAKFQSNPQLAMQEYQNNPEIQQFFKDFCGILGSHFESLGNTTDHTAPSPAQHSQTIRIQDTSNRADMSVHSSTDPKQATAVDEVKMKEILSDPKIVEILKDEAIQKLFVALRSSPDEAQRMLQQLGPQGKEKVQRLVDSGLLGFSSK